MSVPSMTTKQTMLLKTLRKVNADGGFLDIDQVVETLPYETTKQSLQFSLRILINHGLVEKKGTEKRRDRRRVLLGLTEKGYRMIGASGELPL